MSYPELPTEFPYDPDEYVHVESRLKRMLAEPTRIKEAVAAAIHLMDPDDKQAFKGLYTETEKLTTALYLYNWAKEVMDAHDKKEKDGTGVNEHGHLVRDDDIPWLFWYLQIQRRDMAKKLIDDPRKGISVDHAGFFNVVALKAMSYFIDEFQMVAPSLRNIDLGKDDPLAHTI